MATDVSSAVSRGTGRGNALSLEALVGQEVAVEEEEGDAVAVEDEETIS